MSDQDAQDLPSTEQLEAEFNKQPESEQARYDLVSALLADYIDEVSAGRSPGVAKLKRIRKLAVDLPDWAGYARAYLAHLDGRLDEMNHWLAKTAAEWQREAGTPPDVSMILTYYFFLGLPPESWDVLAAAFAQIWPTHAGVITMKGIGQFWAGNDGPAIDYFAQALEQDNGYWLAAWLCAEAYSAQRNWRAARNYYAKAIDPSASEPQYLPELHASLAWCLLKLGDYPSAEQSYRTCLSLDPNHEHAKNNLGWALLKQGRYEEALQAFDEALQDSKNRRTALRNKADTLTKLGRFSEAITTLQQDVHKGSLTKHATREIARLQEMIAHQVDDGAITPCVIEDTDEQSESELPIEDQLAVEEEGPVESIPSPNRTRGSANSPAPSEFRLEQMVEQKIQRDAWAFGRNLKVFDCSAGYGRQFALPGLGRIDLLAEDAATGDLVVIELKQGQSHEQVVGQISMYLAWVRENLAAATQGVRGIICVYAASPKLKLAARSIPNLEVYEYGLSFDRVG